MSHDSSIIYSALNQKYELISVIVPTYNQAKYLPITLDSIWFQSYPNIEIIVVDDGSRDTTKDTLCEYVDALLSEKASFASNYNEHFREVERTIHDRYPKEGRQFVFIEHPINRGLSAALNTGFKAVTGSLCTFIASDDMMLPSMLFELREALAETGADFAYGDMNIVNDEGRILRRFSLPEYTFVNAFCHWYLCGVCKLYRTALHEKVGYYREDIRPQDHEMFLRFAMNGAKFVHLPKVLANVRIHDEAREVHNHTTENWDQLYKESAELVEKARGFLKKNAALRTKEV